MSEELLDYSLHAENGDVYVVKVTRQTAAALQIDHLRTYRLINSVIRSGQKPVGRWLPLDITQNQTAELSMSVSQWEPDQVSTPTKAKPNRVRVADARSPRSPLAKKGKATDVLDDSFEGLQLEEGAVGGGHDNFEADFAPLEAEDVTIVVRPGSERDETFVQIPKTTVPKDAAKATKTAGVQKWVASEDAVHMLINEYGKRLPKFKTQRVHKHLWQEISDVLNANHFRFSADQCRVKKGSLMTYFGKLKVTNGFIGDVKYPFYDGLFHIDQGTWPDNFISGQKCAPKVVTLDDEGDIHNGSKVDEILDDVNNNVEGAYNFLHPFGNKDNGEGGDVWPILGSNQDDGSNASASVQGRAAHATYLVENPTVATRPRNETYIVDNPRVAFRPRNETYIVGNPKVAMRPRNETYIVAKPTISQITETSAQVITGEIKVPEDKPGDQDILEEYEDCKEQWVGRVWKSNIFYSEVSAGVKSRGYDYGSDYCRKRVEAIQDKYRRFYDGVKTTGGAACTWPLYPVCIRVFGADNVAYSPKKTLSVGIHAKMEMGNEVVNTSVRSRRERPPSDLRKKQENVVARLKGTRPIGQRDQMIQLQQRRLELEESFVDEFKGFRADMKARANILRDGMELVRSMKKSGQNEEKETHV